MNPNVEKLIKYQCVKVQESPLAWFHAILTELFLENTISREEYHVFTNIVEN